MKKLFSLFLVIAMLCLLFAGCQEEGNTELGSPSPPDATDDGTEVLYDPFFDSANWVYMTNRSGAEYDGGEVPVSLNDGSIRFFRANQAINLNAVANSPKMESDDPVYTTEGNVERFSFMLKATRNFSIWLKSSSVDNESNNSYRLTYENEALTVRLSNSPYQAAAYVTADYKKAEWNRFDIEFTTNGKQVLMTIEVNGKRASLSAGQYKTNVAVADNTLIHSQPAAFTAGSYFVVKVWYACDVISLKPVYLEYCEDCPGVACIGDSITEGAGATDFYKESYPNQLQGMLGGKYNVINFGMSGRTARTDMGSYDTNPIGWIENLQYQGVQAIVPDIAIVKLGSNDSKFSNSPATTKANFKAAMVRILEGLKAVNPQMRLIICTSAYAYSSAYDISNANIESIIVPVQKELAQEYGAELIDFHTISMGKPSLFPDGIHPSTRGYTMMAEVFATAIFNGSSAITTAYIDDLNARFNG